MLNITDKNNFNFKEVPNQYRPIPFWSWNEKLDTEETRRQILMMRDVGMGGFLCMLVADCKPSTWERNGSKTSAFLRRLPRKTV